MADETTTPTTTAEAGSAAPGGDAPDSNPVETTADTPGFSKESFADVLTRVSDKEPAKTEPTDDTPKPEVAKEEVEKPADKVDLPPEAPKEEDADADDEDLELLSAEEINSKFSNAPKGLRSYAAKIVEKYGPLAEAVEELGGVEAIKRLDTIQSIALGVPDMAEGGNVDQLHDHLKTLNPAMLESFQTKLFYSALDDPKSAEALLNPFIQADPRYRDFTFSKLKELADMVVDGHIDLEEIKEKIDLENPKEAERRRLEAERAEKDEAEKADMRKRLEASEARDKQTARVAEVERVWKKFGEVVAPVMAKFGLKDFIKDSDPEEIKEVKKAYMEDLGHAINRRLEANGLFKDMARRIEQSERGDGYDWLVEKCANIYRGVYREEALKRQGLLSGYLKTYGQEAKKTETRRPEPEVDASKAAHARTTKPEDIAPQAHEEGGLGRLIAAKTQAA